MPPMASRDHENGRLLDDESAPPPRASDAPWGMTGLTDREWQAWTFS